MNPCFANSLYCLAALTEKGILKWQIQQVSKEGDRGPVLSTMLKSEFGDYEIVIVYKEREGHVCPLHPNHPTVFVYDKKKRECFGCCDEFAGHLFGSAMAMTIDVLKPPAEDLESKFNQGKFQRALQEIFEEHHMLIEMPHIHH